MAWKKMGEGKRVKRKRIDVDGEVGGVYTGVGRSCFNCAYLLFGLDRHAFVSIFASLSSMFLNIQDYIQHACLSRFFGANYPMPRCHSFPSRHRLSTRQHQ
jgi:hypothetical protein